MKQSKLNLELSGRLNLSAPGVDIVVSFPAGEFDAQALRAGVRAFERAARAMTAPRRRDYRDLRAAREVGALSDRLDALRSTVSRCGAGIGSHGPTAQQARALVSELEALRDSLGARLSRASIDGEAPEALLALESDASAVEALLIGARDLSEYIGAGRVARI